MWLCYFCPLAGSMLALGGLKVLRQSALSHHSQVLQGQLELPSGVADICHVSSREQDSNPDLEKQ